VGDWIHLPWLRSVRTCVRGNCRLPPFFWFLRSLAPQSFTARLVNRSASRLQPRRFLRFRCLKPVHGAEPHLRENVESFFVQDYPADYEIIFAADEENDAALDIIREVAARHPEINCRILVTGPPQFPNPPASSFTRRPRLLRTISSSRGDSDVEVAPGLSFPSRAADARSFGRHAYVRLSWEKRGRILVGDDAIGMSVEMTAEWSPPICSKG